jgi:ribosome maturation factor RimP
LLDGRRKIRGKLVRREGDQIVLQDGDESISVPISEIDTARVVPDFGK